MTSMTRGSPSGRAARGGRPVAGAGIGAEVALELGRLGADITLMGRTLEPLEEVAAQVNIRERVRTGALTVDVTDEAGVQSGRSTRRSRRSGRRWCWSTTRGSPAARPSNAWTWPTGGRCWR